MDTADVEVIERETCYRGVFRMDRMVLRHRRFDGTWTRPLNRELFIRGTAVAVLPYDPVLDEVVMIEQFRCGAFAAARPAWMTEIVAGMVSPGESSEAVAMRETLEETGLVPIALERIAEFMPSPGALMETVVVYCGRIDATAAQGFHGLAAEDEDIRVFRVPAEEALALLGQGRVDTAITLVALQWLALNRTGLRERWASAAMLQGEGLSAG